MSTHIDDTSPDNCPRCDMNLVGDRIPDDQLGLWDYSVTPPIMHPYDGPPQFYRLAILVEVPGVYDGGLFFKCPSCGARWHRWPEGHYLRVRAEKFVNPLTDERRFS